MTHEEKSESAFSDTETEQEEFQLKSGRNKSKSKKTSVSKQKVKKKGAKPKNINKNDNGKKEVTKKVKSKKAAGGQNFQANKAQVKEYMEKQNRPYNLLNIFDNLHGKIKKSELETILNQLQEEKHFSCKEFGKNKVYFLNQDNFDIHMEEVEKMNAEFNSLREQHKQCKDLNKKLSDEYKKLISKKTLEELEEEETDLVFETQRLRKKIEYLVGQDTVKVDEKEVQTVENQAKKLQKQLKFRRRLTKECLSTFSEMMEKKVSEVAEMMGIELV